MGCSLKEQISEQMFQTMGPSSDLADSKTESAKIWGRIGTCIVVMTCVLTPLSVLYKTPRYLYAESGFADGGDLYSHFIEANHVKEQLRDGIVNFWFSKASLGYPMFTAYQPLPCFVVAVAMLLLERFMSPLLVFRLVFVTVISLIPASLYKSAKCFGLHPMQQISLCLLTFAIQSWRKFGLEVTAFVEYGLMTQAFGMLVLFPAVSSVYKWIFVEDCRMQKAIPPMLTIAVTFMSNFFFGILTCILAGVMLMVKLVDGWFQSKRTFSSIVNFVHMILKSMALISWWIFACLWGYSYIGGLPWRGESEDGYPLFFVLERFTEGDLFDSQRFFPWFTLLFIIGISLECLNFMPPIHSSRQVSKEDRRYSLWIILSTIVSFALFLGRTTFSGLYNLIPLHTELETVKYLGAIHFCSLFHVSYAISRIFNMLATVLDKKLLVSQKNFSKDPSQPNGAVRRPRKGNGNEPIVSRLVWITKYLSTNKSFIGKIVLVLGLSCLLWRNHSKTISSHLTMTEVKQSFIEKLESLKKSTAEGRMLGHRSFGSASSFDLAFLPHFTGKPGLMTYSRGYHDSLSVFYLESLRFSREKMQHFANTLRLYNVHYIATSDIQLDEGFVKACQLKQIAKIDDVIFYEVLHEENDYGYFDFVRLPGYVNGDLKSIRRAVMQMSELYNVNSLLLINPKRGMPVNENVVADVKRISLWDNWNGRAKENLKVTWSSNGIQTDSEALLDKVIKSDSWKWIYSQMIEEQFVGVDYRAIVHVSDRGQDPADMEHLLLKVTYHPFWKCFYYPVSRDYTLDMFQTPHLLDGKTYADVNHVTPNLMSISLPPGRYLVVFTYRFPGVLKILAVFCGCWYLRLFIAYMFGSEAFKSNLNNGCANLHSTPASAIHSNGKTDPGTRIDKSNIVENSELEEGTNRCQDSYKSYEKDKVEDIAANFKAETQPGVPREQEVGEGISWKVNGRLRSHSIAAQNVLRNQTRTLLNSLPGTLGSAKLESVSSDESGEWIDLTGKKSGESKSTSGDSKSDKSDDSESDKSDDGDVSSLKSDESGSRSSFNDSRIGMKAPWENDGEGPKSSLNRQTLSSEVLDANANILSDDCEVVQDFSGPKCSLEKVAAILQSSSSESVDQNKPDSILDLRSRLERLNTGEAASSEDGGTIVKELRQTYLRQRRNTLSALPSLRK